MAVSFKISGKSVLRSIWKCLKGIGSFLTSLVILTAVIVVALYALKVKPYIVTSGSMEPAIPVKSVCFVNEKAPLDDIKVGEVISFRKGEMLVTHRVMEIQDGEYVTKGDANNTEDSGTVTEDNYVGKTIVVIPKVGVFLAFLHSRWGKIIACAVIVLLIAVSFIPDKKKDEQEKSEERRI
ncbi:MAG: signal peptidase I [Oscillospiraceae bacterium]|nr:signal peptidase I [Oscillospiraceae bacterium]